MAGQFSTCGKRQYAAIVLDRHGHVLGTGYNGGPRGMTHCVDGGCPRLSEGSPSGSNYDNCIAIHAEQNAFLHSDYSGRADGCVLVVNGVPCFTCAKLAVNAGVVELIYVIDPSYKQWREVEPWLQGAGVTVRGYHPDLVASLLSR